MAKTNIVGQEEVGGPVACDHRWRYGGVRFMESQNRIPGSGARERWYYDHYYCELCLAQRVVRLPTKDNTYGATMFGATPLGEDLDAG